VHVGNLKALDIMGENALIVDEGEEGDATSHVRSATITVVSDVVQTLELHRFEFERLVEMGTIGQEVLQRVRALQADRREIREALHPPPREQQAIGDDEGDTDGGTVRLVA
jgi:CRP-like cAMP-binding protein